MDVNSEQGTTSPEVTPSTPDEWANKLVESTRTAEEEEQSIAPQEEEAELEEESTDESEEEEPTSQEDQVEEEEEDEEAEAEESEETEPSDESPEIPTIEADDTVIIGGEEYSGQDLINGVAASKNFAQEKHKLREEARQEKDAALQEVSKVRDEHVAGLEMVLGLNQQAMQQFQSINWMQLQQENPAEYQRLQTQQSQMLQHGQQLYGQLQGLMSKRDAEEKARIKALAKESAEILVGKHGSEEEWVKRYGQIHKIAKDVGYSDDEFSQLYDYRFMDLADRALKAEEELASLKSAGQAKLKNPKKSKRRKNSTRVNTTPAKKKADSINRARKSGHPDDWASVLASS